ERARPRPGRAQAAALEVELGDAGVVPGELFATLAHPHLRARRPRAFRIAVDDGLERVEGVLDRLLIAVARPVLRQVGHAAAILDLCQVVAGRVHALEVAEGRD